MKTNENGIDRIIRVIIGVVLGALVVFKVVTGAAAVALGAIAAIAFLTGAVGICGIYMLLGLSTCKTAHSN